MAIYRVERDYRFQIDKKLLKQISEVCLPGESVHKTIMRVFALGIREIMNQRREIISKNVPYVLYRFYGSNDVLLYIGISRSFVKRRTWHKKKSRWYTMIEKTVTTEYPSQTEAEIAERKAIISERPAYNVQYSTISKGLPTVAEGE